MKQYSYRHHKPIRLFPIILVTIVLVVSVVLYDSSTRIVTNEYELAYENLPETFDGLRIVHISDVHAAVFGDSNERLISMAREANPGIIAITGDLIDGYDYPSPEIQLEVAETLVKGLTPIAPVFFVTGNHDWDSGKIQPLLEMLERCGVIILQNSYRLLDVEDDTIIIAGIDDPNGPADMMKPHQLIEQIKKAQSDTFLLMLEHRNDHLPLYSVLDVDLILSGHSHGGLIRLPFTDGLMGQDRDWFPSFTSGVYTMSDTNMVVSRGLGNHTGIPRVFNNPHLVVVVLRIPVEEPEEDPELDPDLSEILSGLSE